MNWVFSTFLIGLVGKTNLIWHHFVSYLSAVVIPRAGWDPPVQIIQPCAAIWQNEYHLLNSNLIIVVNRSRRVLLSGSEKPRISKRQDSATCTESPPSYICLRTLNSCLLPSLSRAHGLSLSRSLARSLARTVFLSLARSSPFLSLSSATDPLRKRRRRNIFFL